MKIAKYLNHHTHIAHARRTFSYLKIPFFPTENKIFRQRRNFHLNKDLRPRTRAKNITHTHTTQQSHRRLNLIVETVGVSRQNDAYLHREPQLGDSHSNFILLRRYVTTIFLRGSNFIYVLVYVFPRRFSVASAENENRARREIPGAFPRSVTAEAMAEKPRKVGKIE